MARGRIEEEMQQKVDYEKLTKEYRQSMLEMQFNGMTSAAMSAYEKSIAYGNK